MSDLGGSAGIVVRRSVPADLANLGKAVELARAADEFRGSSDPDGSFFLRMQTAMGSPLALAADADGAVAGFASSEVKVTWVRSDLRRRGIGRRLVDVVLEIERERGVPEVLMGLAPDDETGRAFLIATGFAYHSTLWDLALPPDIPVAPPAWPAGVRVRPLAWEPDKRAFRDLFNAAFADHATPLQMPEELLDAPPDPSIEDADTLLLEADSGGLIGFCATTPERRDGVVGPHAEIWTVGVLPAYQGRGLGHQLLRWGVGRLRSLGVRDVVLSVNSRNEGALHLYEREGFVRQSTRERWARPVEPATAA